MLHLTRVSCALIFLLALGAPAWGDVMVLGDSGWSVEAIGTRVAIDVHLIDVDHTGEGTVRISIDKDFGPALWTGDEVDFPVGILSFTRTEPGTVPVGRIVIDHEDIHNGTGAAWTLFRWDLFQGSAAFDATASAGWVVAPEFAGWTPFFPSGGGYMTIAATGGAGVPDGGDFNPIGGLVIVADDDFDLKEQVLPEPGSLAVLLTGGPALLGRRRRRPAK